MKNIGEFSGFFYIKIRMIVETRIYHQQKKKRDKTERATGTGRSQKNKTDFREWNLNDSPESEIPNTETGWRHQNVLNLPLGAQERFRTHIKLKLKADLQFKKIKIKILTSVPTSAIFFLS